MLDLLFLLSPVAQSALVSPSSSTQLAVDPVVHDEGVILRDAARADSALYWPRASWYAQLGDLDGDGQLDTLPGLDALSVWKRPDAAALTPHDLVFSTESDFAGFLDGDLLRMKPGGGLQVLVSETELEQALALQSGRLDVDALVAAEQMIWFSVKDSLDTLALGQVEDGDILLYDRNAGLMLRYYSESDVQAMIEQANPGHGALGDVKALSLHPHTGELVFSVQSPTAEDASLFGDGGGGRRIPGFQEGDYGFQVSTELDAFTFLPESIEQPPILKVDLPYASSGEQVNLRLHHAAPDAVLKGLMGRRLGFAEAQWTGIAALYLDESDPTYQRQWANGWLHRRVADGGGSASFTWQAPTLPPTLSHVDHYFQALDVTRGSLSNPIVVRLR